MLFFPIVGLLCGGGLWLVWTVCQLLHRSAYLFAVLAVLVNVWITGGIHLDGFCDTADALYSRRPMEEKLRILKDPNCGPFAVFAVILVLLVQVAAYAQIYTEQNRLIIGLLTGGFWLSRCLSGISVTRFPCTPTSSLVKTFGEHAGKRVGTALIVISLLSAVAPSASIVPQFCQMFGRDARYASLISTVTMLLCIITMPLMISLFQI